MSYIFFFKFALDGSWFKFATGVDLSNCLKQIELSISIYKCAPMSEFPSNITTMDRWTEQVVKVACSLSFWIRRDEQEKNQGLKSDLFSPMVLVSYGNSEHGAHE